MKPGKCFNLANKGLDLNRHAPWRGQQSRKPHLAIGLVQRHIAAERAVDTTDGRKIESKEQPVNCQHLDKLSVLPRISDMDGLEESSGDVAAMRASRPEKLKAVRVEALRAGFKRCWAPTDCKTIGPLGDLLPPNMLPEEAPPLMYDDIAKDNV
jgi:hypothetical protein